MRTGIMPEFIEPLTSDSKESPINTILFAGTFVIWDIAMNGTGEGFIAPVNGALMLVSSCGPIVGQRDNLAFPFVTTAQGMFKSLNQLIQGSTSS